MSYGALHSLADENGTPTALAWLWPLVVDGFILVASLSVLHAVLEARSSRYPWVLLLGFSAVSIAGNVAHGTPTTVGRLVAAVPPVALVLAFDLLMRQVRRVLVPSELLEAAETGFVVSTQTVPAVAREQVTSSSTRTVGAPTTLRLPRPTVAGQAARLVARRRASGGAVTGGWLAGELEISTGYARRLLRQLDPPSIHSQAMVHGAAHTVRVGGSR